MTSPNRANSPENGQLGPEMAECGHCGLTIPAEFEVIGYLCQGEKTGPRRGFHSSWTRDRIIERGWTIGPDGNRVECPDCWPVYRKVSHV